MARMSSKTLVSILLAASLLGSTAVMQLTRLNQQVSASSDQLSKAGLAQQDLHTRLQLQLQQNLPDFGFRNVIANWTYLNFLQYFGDIDTRAVSGYQLSPYFFDVIVDRDPFFLIPYTYLTTSVSMYAGLPKKTVELLETGLSVMAPNFPPDSYYLWRFKGIDELLFLGDSLAAQKSFESAAEWAEVVGTPEAQEVAQISLQTAEFLSQDPSSRVAQINSWALVLVRAVDDQTRANAVREIESLGGTVLVNDAGQVIVRYREDES